LESTPSVLTDSRVDNVYKLERVKTDH